MQPLRREWAAIHTLAANRGLRSRIRASLQTIIVNKEVAGSLSVYWQRGLPKASYKRNLLFRPAQFAPVRGEQPGEINRSIVRPKPTSHDKCDPYYLPFSVNMYHRLPAKYLHTLPVRLPCFSSNCLAFRLGYQEFCTAGNVCFRFG